MGFSLGSILVDLLKANSKDPNIVSCTLSPAETEEIVDAFNIPVRPKIEAYRRRRILRTPELQKLTFR